MFSSDDDDSQNRFILAIVFGLIGALIAGVLTLGISKMHGGKNGAAKDAASVVVPPMPQPAAAAAAALTAVAANAAANTAATEPTPATPTPAAPAVDATPAGASIKVENGTVKFYFATAKADLASGANTALAEIVSGVKNGKRAKISGFHDAAGDPQRNAKLAKRRAQNVRDALLGLGVAESKIELVKPAETTGSGDAAEARRVEVVLVD